MGQTPLHGYRLRTPATETGYGHHYGHHQRTSLQQFYNKFATSQCQSPTSRHVKMLECGKFLSVGGVRSRVRSRCPCSGVRHYWNSSPIGLKPLARRWNWNFDYVSCFRRHKCFQFLAAILLFSVLSVSLLFVHTLFELSVVENFAFTTRITAILTLEAFRWMSQYELKISPVSK